jgi:hypothetical protein
MLSEIFSGLFIADSDPDFLPIPDPGSRGQKGTGSRIRIRNIGLVNNYKKSVHGVFRYYILPETLPLENLLIDEGPKKRMGGMRGGRGAGGRGGMRGGPRGRGRGRGGPRGGPRGGRGPPRR